MTRASTDAFRVDGAVKVAGLLSAEEVEAARAVVDRVLAHPGPRFIEASSTDDPGRFVEDFCRSHDIPALDGLARSPRIAAVARALLGGGPVRFFHDHVLVKEPGTRQRTPWHQDQPYYNVDGTRNVSFWIPLDPVPAAGSLEIVAGTHTGPWLMPRTFLTGEARWFPEGTLAELPDIDADRGAHRILAWDLEPGDAVAFHFLAVHGSPGFPGPGRRRVLSLRYLGDDATHAPRPWRTSPEFPGLDTELPAGAAMDHPLFPLVTGEA